MTGRFALFSGARAVVAAAILAVAAGCGTTPQPGGLPPAPSSATAAPSPSVSAKPVLVPPVPVTTGTPEYQIQAQARLFLTHALPAAYLAPAARRRAILSPVTTDPALSDYVRETVRQDKAGQQTRGVGTILGQTVQRSGPIALVTICADTRATGLYDKNTGRRLRQGAANDHLLFTLKQDRAGIWKVSASDYKDTKCSAGVR